MKRYLLFSGEEYNSCGGWSEFVADYDDYAEIEKKVEEIKKKNEEVAYISDWYQIVDTDSALVIEEG